MAKVIVDYYWSENLLNYTEKVTFKKMPSVLE